jgi:hypothetical protein
MTTHLVVKYLKEGMHTHIVLILLGQNMVHMSPQEIHQIEGEKSIGVCCNLTAQKISLVD